MSGGARLVLDGGVQRSSEDERNFRHIVLANSAIQVLLVTDARCEKRAAAAMCVHGAGARTAPEELPGLAHYLEHMLFLGSRKYPAESHYKKVVALRNGRCNASTSPEDTVFHFEVDSNGFEDVLDVFAQFFIGEPLLDWNAAERELNAVTAEDSRNRINDDRRARMVLQHTVSQKDVGVHTWAKFGTGNSTTLGPDAATAAGVDVRSALWAYRETFYRHEKMALCLISAASLDELEAIARKVWDAKASTMEHEATGSQSSTVAEREACEARDQDEASSTDDTHLTAMSAARALVYSAKEKAMQESAPHPWADGATQWPLVVGLVPIKERRNISVLWPLPVSCAQHRSADAPVTMYLAHLIGHEGDGSLFAALQYEGLATSVFTSTYIDCPTFCALRVTISLTPKGEEHIDHVLSRLYEYVGVLIAAGEGEEASRQWEDIASLSAINFHYSERGEAMESAKEWARLMHIYGPKHVLTGGRLLGSFPGPQVKETLELISPNNSLVLYESRTLASAAAQMPDDDDESDSVAIAPPAKSRGISLIDGGFSMFEPYYGIGYTKAPLSGDLIKTLEEARRIGMSPRTDKDGPVELGLPRTNSYIPTDFRMVKSQSAMNDANLPERIDPGATASHHDSHTGLREQVQDASKLMHWHQTHIGFGRPKAHVAIAFSCSPSCTMLGTPASMTLWLRLLDQRLATALYPAFLAGMRWSLQPTNLGFQLFLWGFSQKLPALAAVLIKALLTWDDRGFEPLFEAKRDALVRSLRSHSKSRADTLASYFLELLLCPQRVPVSERLTAAEELELEALRHFHSDVITRLGTRLFTFGNMSCEGALDLASIILREMRVTRSMHLQRSEWASSVVTRLQVGTWRLQLKPLSEEENNSGVVCYYQCGQFGADVRVEAKLRLLLRLIKQPLFDELRTRQQLGYAVSLSARDTGRGIDTVTGFQVTILSKLYPPPHLQRAIDGYMRGISEMLPQNVTDSEFTLARSALATRLLEPDRTLSEAFHTRWGPIEEEDFRFDRDERLAAAVEETTFGEVVALARDILTLPRLLVHVFGNPHVAAFDDDDGTGATPIEDWTTWRLTQEVWPSAFQTSI